MRYFEDLEIGAETYFGSYDVTREEVLEFAHKYDPQPFHISDEEAAKTHFGQIAASGWHTAALSMRLLVESGFRPAGGIIGTRAEELRWPKAVRPGDELEVEAEVVEVRASASRPGHGYVKCRAITRNQHGEPVQVLVMHLLVEARGGRGA